MSCIIPKMAVLMILPMLTLLAHSRSASKTKEYQGKDGRRVLISAHNRPEATDESKIEFYSADDRLLCGLDYSSEDGEHGFGVVKAEWTPDQKYFVFSLASSGGHQAWHSPTLFYNTADDTIRALDSYTSAAGISTADFILKPPNVVLTEVWRGESHPIRFHLDSLTTIGGKSVRAFHCFGGRTIKGTDD